MKHLLLLHFFLLSVASAQEPTPEQVAIMQQEMACADGDYSTKKIFEDLNQSIQELKAKNKK